MKRANSREIGAVEGRLEQPNCHTGEAEHGSRPQNNPRSLAGVFIKNCLRSS